MTNFAILLLCIQACLIQAAFGSCGCKAKAPKPWPSMGCSKYASTAGYGAAGMSAMGSGDVGVTGQLDVTGATTVAGSVPVLGGLTFSGPVPASGLVTISGACAYPQPAPCAYRADIAGAEIAGAIIGAEMAAAEFAAPRYIATKPSCGCN